MNKLNELIKKTKCSVTIEINSHKETYSTISDYIEREFSELSDEVFNKMVELDSCICLSVYPDTPIGFYVIYHYDLEMAIDIALDN